MNIGGTEAQSEASVGPKGIQLTESQCQKLPRECWDHQWVLSLQPGLKGNEAVGLTQPGLQDLRRGEEAEKAVRRAHRGGELSSRS